MLHSQNGNILVLQIVQINLLDLNDRFIDIIFILLDRAVPFRAHSCMNTEPGKNPFLENNPSDQRRYYQYIIVH
ncbi:MAG TPA: hypothetical protein DCO79_16925 [Spirochaeta sp.]|nr:hypothetical protein [Spirochaeta sp.]